VIDKKAARKRITEQVLMERLSLDEEWLNPDNLPLHFHQQLPRSLQRDKSPATIRDIERDVDRLVAVGCDRGVVYWCLEQLTGEEEEFRMRGALIPVLEEDEHSGRVPMRQRPLATQEDMLPLINRVRSASRFIEKYKRELMFTAEGFMEQIPLPEAPLMEGPSDPSDALLLLKSALLWARRLAEHWAAPQLSTVMRSKGTLFLAAYASLHSGSKTLRIKSRAARGLPAANNAVFLARPHARVVVRLIDVCGGIAIHEDDLVAKLKDFYADYPLLYNRLISLLNHLHREATTQDQAGDVRINSRAKTRS
jgi:hypothetical protein